VQRWLEHRAEEFTLATYVRLPSVTSASRTR
jgi:hypothetical protein